ncbi:hypothetical protein BDZ97DRAFT_1928449 [Flammula alnicola]|nr:hypothetical protein BDZ97DRAFT_1928449 [Flammula alnicola]
MVSQADSDLIDSLSTRIVTEFRNETFPNEFILKHPEIFLDHQWINMTKLRQFISQKGIEGSQARVEVKVEVHSACIKKEPDSNIQLTPVQLTGSFRTRVLHEEGHEVLELLSDDDEIMSDNFTLKPPTVTKMEEKTVAVGAAHVRSESVDDVMLAFDPSMFTELSETNWTDSDMTTSVIEEAFQVTTELRVGRVEYLDKIPLVWPIPQTPTSFILDLRDKKFLVRKQGDIPVVVTPDFLIKNKDQDSWTGGTGRADSTSRVCFQPGFPSVVCWRTRLVCRGAYACEAINDDLINIERYDLDPAPRDRILKAKQVTRVEERSTAEQRAATFLNVCHSTGCKAIGANGKQCTGKPMMKEKPRGQTDRGHRYWIACSGWNLDCKKNHRTRGIPDDIDEDILAKLMTGKPLSEGNDTNECSLILPSHVGRKQALCPHPHIQNGRSDKRMAIKSYPCLSRRTIYIPVDTSKRFALVTNPKCIPHNHPMPCISKASYETKAVYQKCVEEAGVLGATVQKVDQAPSTKALLNGNTPGQYNSALYNECIKQGIVWHVKTKKNPAGLGVTGVFDLYQRELAELKSKDRYIHSFITTREGGTLIFTCVPSLLKLIHEVTSFECDVTFKRVEGLNEWEMVIYYPPVQRAITIARVYINKADTEHYTQLFDELQALTLNLTGKILGFLRLTFGGNLLCMNADMEAAQILGAGRSFLRTLDPEFSGINISKPEELLAYFVRVCLTHSKRGVLDFKLLVSAPDYKCLLNFPYMKSQEELDEFTTFVASLAIKKINDWWSHKIGSSWIIPCILGSQSKILPEHWSTTPATTNVGESQHHWTNTLTGIGLPLLEGIQTARRVDEQVAAEVEASLATGILKNTQTSLFHRQLRASQRVATTIRKSREMEFLQENIGSVKQRIEAEKAFRKASLDQQHVYEERLKSMSSATGQARMSVQSYQEANNLRQKIDNEKHLRRESTAKQKVLADELKTISTSATGRPLQAVHAVKQSNTTLEASSSGRVSDVFSEAQDETDLSYHKKAHNFSDAEKLEMDLDPDADSEPLPESALEQDFHMPDQFQQEVFSWNTPQSGPPSDFTEGFSLDSDDPSFTDMLNDYSFDFQSDSNLALDLDLGQGSTSFDTFSDPFNCSDSVFDPSYHYGHKGQHAFSSASDFEADALNMSTSSDQGLPYLGVFLPSPNVPSSPPPPSPPSTGAVEVASATSRSSLKRIATTTVSADFHESFILPQEQRRKRFKPSRLGV